MFVCLCALWPEFGRFMARWVSAPVSRAVVRISALTAFPLVLAALAVVGVLFKPRALLALTLAAALFCLTWVPALCTGARKIEEATRPQLAALCVRLVGELNTAGRAVAEGDEALRVARRAMAAPAMPRAARFPRLMRRLGLAGIYIPITGAAVVDVTRPAPGLTFTAAHELAHMRGIAHEAAANIAAYEACVRHGGAAAYSARLWALRYALARLGDDWRYVSGLNQEMRRDLARIPYSAGSLDEYAALADHLAAR